MATIIPISSKSGVAIFAGFRMYGEQWNADLTIENDRLKHFEMTADANSLSWAQTLTGFAMGTGSVRMLFDNTPAARPMPDKLVWMDKTGTGWLGYTSLVGFIITFTITNVRPGSNTDNPKSTYFDFDFNINSCTFSTTGP